jgi:hypothetical protein
MNEAVRILGSVSMYLGARLLLERLGYVDFEAVNDAHRIVLAASNVVIAENYLSALVSK